ncbi:hypothetical protein [Salinibacter phage 4_17]
MPCVQESKREPIDTGAFRAALVPGRQDRSLYRLELVRVVDPTPRGGKVWRAQYTWPFPMEGLTTWEVQDAVSTYDEKARRRYERKRRKMDERSAYREKRRREHEDPAAGADVEIEHTGDRTLCRLKE